MNPIRSSPTCLRVRDSLSAKSLTPPCLRKREGGDSSLSPLPTHPRKTLEKPAFLNSLSLSCLSVVSERETVNMGGWLALSLSPTTPRGSEKVRKSTEGGSL